MKAIHKVILISSTFLSSTYSLANTYQDTITHTKANPDVYLMSSNGKCHGPLSSARNSVKLKKDKSNSFPDMDTCIDDGGELTAEQIQKQTTLTLLELQKKSKEEEKKENQEKIDKKFLGFNWGLGLAFTKIGDPAISDINIASQGEGENGIILVNHQSEHRAIAMLETHYFFERIVPTCNTKDEVKLGTADSSQSVCTTTWGQGPYIAIGLTGTNNVDPLSTYSLGWMVGFKRDDGTSWNMGIGLFVDTKVQQLRDGFADGAETSITDIKRITKQREKVGGMLMFSSTF